MALFSITRDALIERILDLLMPGPQTVWYEGTATGGSTTTLVDTSRYEEDDYFQNTSPQSWVYVRTTTDSAAPIGQTRRITDWVQSSGTATIAPALTATLASGDTYAIINEYQWAEVVAAINMAIDRAAMEGLWAEKIDESVALRTTTYEYSIPSGFRLIYRITPQDTQGDYPEEIPYDQWRIVRGASTPQIHLQRFPVDQQAGGFWYHGLWADAGTTPTNLVIEDCDNAWADQALDSDVTVTFDATDLKQGNASTKLTIAAGASANDLLISGTNASLDLTNSTYVGLWIKSSITLSSGDLQLLLSNIAAAVSPLESLDIPAISTADEWTYVTMALANPVQDGAIISHGIKMITDSGAYIVRFDAIEAVHTLRIEGFSKQDTLSADTTTCGLYPEFVTQQAAAYLHQKRIGRSDIDPDMHSVQYGIAQANADRALRAARVQLPMNTKRVEPF